MALIKQLQEQEHDEIKAKSANRSDNEDTINCSICLGSLYDEEFTPIECCTHAFHTDCFKEFLKTSVFNYYEIDYHILIQYRLRIDNFRYVVQLGKNVEKR